MKKLHICWTVWLSGMALLIGALASVGSAQIVLLDPLDSGATWTVLSTGDNAATFGYDYSLDGIPEAPNSGLVGGAARTGLKLEANLTSGEVHEIAAIPNGFNLSGRYRIQVDIWMNYAVLGLGQTEFAGAFVGHDGLTPGRNGSGFVFTGDGGSARDYRLYKNTSEMFLEGGYYSAPLGELPDDLGPPRSNDNSHPFMEAAYPSFDVGFALDPIDAQGPDQVGFGFSGAGGFQWMTLEIYADSAGAPGGGSGLGIAEARLTSATSGTTVWMGTVDSNRGNVASTTGSPALVYWDAFASVADPPQFQFGIFDNFIIEQFISTVTGDFNNDGVWDCSDLNALTAAIASMSTDLSFDMNGDGVITLEDITDPNSGWLAVGGANNPTLTGGNPFLPGDATLDGVVDGADFLAWNTNKFTSTTAWCEGDFNADGAVDGSDFLVWNLNKFTSSFAAVPEPVSALMLMMGLGLLAMRRGT